jgi:predicted neuraminidase
MLGVALITAAQLRAEPAFERVTISSVRQYTTSAYPTLDRLADGRLLCVYSAIDGQATRGKAVIVATRSADSGGTWSKPIVLIDSRPDLDYDPNIIVIGPRVIVTSTTVPPTHGQFISTSRTVAVRSEDSGKTWSKSYDIPMGHRYTSGKINRGIVLRDGTALFGYSWDIALDKTEKITSEGQEECRACLMASTDRGLTWKTISHVTTRDRKLADRVGAINGLDEPALVELSDGAVYMLCRTGLTKLYESRSTDGGKTWSAAAPSPLTSHNAPASLCRIGGKKPGILAVWCNSSTSRWPLCAAASFDDCRTWSTPRRLTERDGHEQSYPACIEAPDGRLVVAWQEIIPGGREIRAARFNLDWLLDDT